MSWREQVAYSFDLVTIRKIIRGAMHAAVVAALLAILDYFLTLAGTIQSNNIIVVAGLAWFAQTGYQTARQWVAGI